MNSVSPEIYFAIGLNIDYLQISEYCQINRIFYQLCLNPYLWERKIVHDFGLRPHQLIKLYKTVRGSPQWPREREAYLKLAGEREIPIPGAEKYNFIYILTEKIAERICESGLSSDIKLLNYFIGVNKWHPFFLSTFVILGKCGKIDIMENLMTKYPQRIPDILNGTLIGASKAGNLPLVKSLIRTGGSYMTAARSAFTSGNIALLKYLFTEYPLNPDSFIYFAAETGNPSLVQYLLDHGATDYQEGLEGAAAGASIEIFNQMMALGAHDINRALIFAAGGKLEMVKYIVENLGATALNPALPAAAARSKVEIVKYLISRGATNINDALLRVQNVPTAQVLIQNGATNIQELLYKAITGGNIILVEYLLDILNNSPLEQYLELAQKFNKSNIVDLITNLISNT